MEMLLYFFFALLFLLVSNFALRVMLSRWESKFANLLPTTCSQRCSPFLCGGGVGWWLPLLRLSTQDTLSSHTRTQQRTNMMILSLSGHVGLVAGILVDRLQFHSERTAGRISGLTKFNKKKNPTHCEIERKMIV
jgi:hypothetical protein